MISCSFNHHWHLCCFLCVFIFVFHWSSLLDDSCYGVPVIKSQITLTFASKNLICQQWYLPPLNHHYHHPCNFLQLQNRNRRPKVSKGDVSSLAECYSCAVRVSAIGKLPCVVHDNDEDEDDHASHKWGGLDELDGVGLGISRWYEHLPVLKIPCIIMVTVMTK